MSKLLILDDDPLTGQTIKTIAEFSGFDVRFCDESQSFFSSVNDWEPQLIALDLVMPGMDGVEVLAKLAEMRCKANIIITSGVGSRVLDAARRSAEERGLSVLGTLSKPYSLKAFRAIVEQKIMPEKTTKVMSDSRTVKVYFEPASLKEALDNDGLTVAFQPKVGCKNRLLCGFEALARIKHPKFGNIPPDVFVPLAEKSDLIDQLTEAVLIRSLNWLINLSTCQNILEALPGAISKIEELSVSINVSARSLGNRKMFDRLVQYCAEKGLSPGRIILELTETATMVDPTFSLDTLTRLRMQGFQLSIDDFGTGFSSMLQLVRLPFSEMKVDKSFVATALDSIESRAVVRSIIELGQSLNLQIVAEGVENLQTLELLQSMGCHLVQGYYISRALEGKNAEKWIVKHLKDWDSQRIVSLEKLFLLDTKTEARFDRHTRLARRLFNVPIALVTLVDNERQWFKSHQGIDVKQTSREDSFCTHAILCENPFVIGDTFRDSRFRDNNLVVSAPYIRFYAGAPLCAIDGKRLGTLCLIDTKPRELDERGKALLVDVAKLVEEEIRTNTVANKDHLTGLLNRIGFEERSIESLALCKKRQIPATLVLFNVIISSPSAECYEQHTVDKKLVTFGQVLRETIRESDLVSRFDGGAFYVLLLDADRCAAKEVESRINQRLKQIEEKLDGSKLVYSVTKAHSTLGRKYDFFSLLDQIEEKLEMEE